MNENKTQKRRNQKAKDVAAIMVENMKKNMEDHEFLNKKERIRQEVADKVIKEREERRKKLKED